MLLLGQAPFQQCLHIPSLPCDSGGAATTRTSLPQCHCHHIGKKGHKRRENLSGSQGKASIHTISLNWSISNLLLEQKKQQVQSFDLILSRALHYRGFRQYSTPRLGTLISNFSNRQDMNKVFPCLLSPFSCKQKTGWVGEGNTFFSPNDGHRQHGTFEDN